MPYTCIPLPFKVTSEAVAAIETFNKACKREDLYISYTEAGCNLYLRAAAIDQLEALEQEIAHPLITEALKEIKNIKSYAPQAGKRIYLDYNSERKVQARKAKEQQRSPHYYSQSHPFTKEVNTVPADRLNSILEGDSLKLLSTFPENCVDLIFTSPPYNFGLDYAHHEDDAAHWEQYFAQLFAIFDECIRVLKYGGRIVVNVQPLFSDYIPSHHFISQHFVKKKLIWKGEILWEKHNYNCKYTAWGSWKSPSNPYLKYTWEFLEIFCKGSLKKEGGREHADISAEEFKKWVTGRWSIAPERNMKAFGHPAMFPRALAERVIKLLSFQHDLILDPFNGVGTTTAAAKALQRKYIGIDISKKYCQIAKKRLKNTIVQTNIIEE